MIARLLCRLLLVAGLALGSAAAVPAWESWRLQRLLDRADYYAFSHLPLCTTGEEKRLFAIRRLYDRFQAHPEQLPTLLAHADPRLRATVAHFLEANPRPETAPALRELLSDLAFAPRLCAALALAELGDSDSFSTLTTLLEQPEWEAQREVISALGVRADPRALPALQAAAERAEQRDDWEDWKREHFRDSVEWAITRTSGAEETP